MSSQSPKPGVLGGRTAVPIRPAVPLIYEPRPRGAEQDFNEGNPVSNSSSSNGNNSGAKPEEVRTPTQDAQEQPSGSPRPELDNQQSLRSREVVDGVFVQTRNATNYEAQEMKKDLLEMSKLMASDSEEESDLQQPARAASPTDLEWSSRGGSTLRLILGVEVGDSNHSMRQEESPSHTTPSQHSSTRGKTSSGDIYDIPTSSTESNFEASNMLPPMSYPAPYIQFGSYVNGIPPQQVYGNQYLVPQYDPQAQYRFMQPWHGVAQFNPLGGQPPPTPSSASLEEGNIIFDPKLAGHISSNFNVERYADIRLIVTHEQKRFEETTVFLHRVLVSRSETVRCLLEEYAGNYDGDDGKLVVKMRLNDQYITPTALAAALHTCYGQPASSFLPSKSGGRAVRDRDQSVADMVEILAFAAAGHLLRLEGVALRGIEKAQEALNWDTLEYALSFGMQSCTHRRESSEALLLKSFSYPTPEGDLFSVDCAHYMLDLSLSFMASYFPDSWILDRSVRRLPMIDRLPVTDELPRNRVKSKLARIQFGQLTQEVDPNVVDRDELISSIVLSVPFTNLCHIAANKAPSLIHQLPQIIEERERRRLVALNSDVYWNERRLGKETEWYAVGFHESCTPMDPNSGGSGLSCSPVSIYNNSVDEEEAKKRDQASQDLVQNQRGSEPWDMRSTKSDA